MHAAAALFQRICYENKDALSAGIIVAGWDKEVGPSVYNIPLGGGLFRQPWAIGGEYTSYFAWVILSLNSLRVTGSGSTYVYGYCDATYKEGWGRDETVNFVKNSAYSVIDLVRPVLIIFISAPSSRTRNVSRWFIWRGHPYVRNYRGRCRAVIRSRR